MVLKLNVIYQLYIKELVDKIDKAKKQIKELGKEKDLVLSLLNKYEIVINQSYDLPYNKLIKITTLKEFESIANSNTNKLIHIYFERLIRVNRKISTLKSTIKSCEGQIITYQVFKEVCYKFNQKVIDAIVEQNYYFKPSQYFGGVGIVVNETNTLRVDWGKSNKKKAELESKGLIPYKKADAEKAAKNDEEYNGIEWLVYRSPIDYFYYWFKNKAQRDFLPIISDFRFVPARRRSPELLSPVRKLENVKKDRTKAAALYTRKIKVDGN